MEQSDLEVAADSVVRLAGVDGGPVKLAKALNINVISVPNMRLAGCLAKVNGVTTIAVRGSLSPEQRRHTVGHELGHWILEREGVLTTEWTEDWCDYIGGALVAPRQAIRRAFSAMGEAFAMVAKQFCATETLVALRLGEVTGQGVAVVAPKRVRARGETEWPSESTLRTWARRPAPGVRATRLQDNRVCLLEA